MTKPGSVLLGYLHEPTFTVNFVQSLEALRSWDASHNQLLGQFATMKCEAGGIPEGRDRLVDALLSSDCEWLFMVDSDMGFAPDTLDRLLDAAASGSKPVVGALCFAWREAATDGMGGFRHVPRPTILDWIEHEDGVRRFTGRLTYPADSMVQCGATGAACMVIHRRVFEKLAEQGLCGTREGGRPSWYARVPDSTGALLGEDVSFGVRCMAAGIPTWVHTGIRTTHAKTIYVSEQDFLDSQLPTPATDFVGVVAPELSEPSWTSLLASTGLARFCDLDDIRDEVRWLLFPTSDTVFGPGWLDHAQHTAATFGAEVVMLGGTVPMISRDLWDRTGDVDAAIAEAIDKRTFQTCPAAKVWP